MNAPAAETHLASVLVHARGDAIPLLRSTIAADPAIEIGGERDGKLVLLVECRGDRALLDRIDAIHALPGVLSAVLVYHQVESPDALDEEA
jgi:nitrate reductase NapD